MSNQAAADDGFGASLGRQNPEKLALAMRSLNVIISALLLATGVMAFFNFSFTPVYFLFSVYTVFFSAVLLLFELRLGKIDAFVGDNFGFMFSWNGRAFFMVFLAAMSFGLEPKTMSTITSIITVVVVFVNVFILCSNPGVASHLQRHCTALSYNSAAEQSVGNYTAPAHNPAESAVSFAADNPEAAHKGIDALSANPNAAKRMATMVTGDSGASSRAVDMIASNPNAAKSAVSFAAKHKDVAASAAGLVWNEVSEQQKRQQQSEHKHQGAP